MRSLAWCRQASGFTRQCSTEARRVAKRPLLVLPSDTGGSKKTPLRRAVCRFLRYETVRVGERFPVARWCQNGANGHYAGAVFRAPKNDVEALTLALRLAVTAPTDEKADLVLEQAEILAARMTEEEVDQAKAAAEEWTSSPAAWGDKIANALSQFLREQDAE